MLPVRTLFSDIFYFLNSHSIHYKMCLYYCCSRPASLSLSYFSIFAVVDHLEFRETNTSRFGLSMLFVMIVVCRNFWLLVNIILQTMPPRTAQGKDVNLRVVYAASAMGISRGDISKFCKIFFHGQRYLAQSCISYSTL